MRPNLSKQIFLDAVKCPAAGWARRHDKLEDDDVDFYTRQAREVERLARSVFPDGRLIEAMNIQRAAQETAQLIDTADIGTLFDVHTLFEPTFVVHPYVTKADILRRGSTGWHLYEVKMCTQMEKREEKEYIDDMAYTAMVIQAWGLTVSSVSLMILDKNYRPGMAYDRLFRTLDYSENALPRSEEFLQEWNRIDEVTSADEIPETDLELECRRCPYFKQFIWPEYAHHIFELPNLRQKRFQPLKERGIERIEDIPPDIELTDPQQRVRDCIQSGQPLVESELTDELDRIEWPAFYLDFETVGTALPLFSDVGPFEAVPFQYSIHVCTAPGKVQEHREFLAEPGEDQRRQLAESLLDDLEDAGSILVYYAAFEEGRIRELAEAFPDLADPLLALIDRIVDLLEIIKKNVCHPDFHGSNSIKKTLPALVPNMSYENLEIGEGGDAMAQYAGLVWDDHDADEAATILDNLRAYCKQDTEAMVRLHEQLVGLVSRS